MAAHKLISALVLAFALCCLSAPVSWAADTLPEPAEFGLPFEGGSPGESTDIINLIIGEGIQYVGIFSVLVLIYGGILMIISYGEEDKTKTARLVITYALVGVITAGAGYFLVNIVNNIRL